MPERAELLDALHHLTRSTTLTRMCVGGLRALDHLPLDEPTVEALIALAFTERDDDTIRIISMMRATNHERIRYEQLLRDQLGDD